MTEKHYHPVARCSHSTAVSGDRLYLWGGNPQALPADHSGLKKLEFLSSVDVFDLKSGVWELVRTYGTPPLGFSGYSVSAATGESLFYFGGYCGHDNCYHNSIHKLDTRRCHWTELSPTNADHGPMRKMQCGMVTFSDADGEHLVIVGGYGLPPMHAVYAEYVEGLFDSSKGTTNEIHVFTPHSGKQLWCFNIGFH